jgi:hypothetical protein
VIASGWLFLLSSQAVWLTSVDGSRVPFDPASAKASAVVFLSTVCPVSNDYHDRIVSLWREFGSRPDTRFLAVYPNKTESLEDIRRHAERCDFRLRFSGMAIKLWLTVWELASRPRRQ